MHLYAPPSSRASESWFTESACLGAWLEQLPKPIGLMACNDDRARMVADVCRTRAIRVPDDIAILGVDNDEHVCLRTTPALSSLALATERAGYDAAALLDRLLSGKKVDSRVIVTRPVGVVPRQSTDLIASNDPNVVKAVRFIREQSKRVVQVPDVAAAAGLSRRVLQERFKRSMGNTVLEAIHASRIQNLRFLLAETTMPVAAIAAACGYETDTHLARFFTRHTGMTPSAYRRLHHKG